MSNLISKPAKGNMLGTAASRASVNAATAANGAPTAAGDGVACHGWRWVLVTLQSAVGTSAEFAIWTYDDNSGKWVRDDQLGTAGTITVVTATEGGLQRHWFEVTGCAEIYVELEAVNGASEAASAWVTLSA